ncbi:MAG: 3-dehydroquinate synthase, partial [Sulfurimonadaceae bacterium]
AEVIKMAVCFDADFFAWLEEADLSDEKQLSDAVAKSVQTKAWVVAQDEKERGLRAALNYGHTFGHVIENETNYTGFLHGEAVAIGMVMANDTAVELGWMSDEEATRVKALLERYELPTTYEIKDVDSFYETFYLDKKSADSAITFIIPKSLGGVEITDEIDESVIKKVLKQYAVN